MLKQSVRATAEKPAKSPRNKTLFVTEDERQSFAPNLMRLNTYVAETEIAGKTINQDLLEAMRYLPQAFADLIIIDPPYNLSKDYETIKFKKTSDSDYECYINSWLPQVVNFLKPNGSIYVCCDWRSTSVIYQCLSGLVAIKNRITWQREKGRGAKSNWKNAMEDIWFGVKNDSNYYFDVNAVMQKRKVIAPYKVDGKPKDWEESVTGNFRLTCPSNFWDDISIPYWSMPENTAHPTQKPEKLVAKLILASCPEGGMVFDPFLGSGTTSVVAKKLNRNFCGVEINTEYCMLTEKRLQWANQNRSIQGYCDNVFWERNTLSEQKKAKNYSCNKDMQAGLFSDA